MQYNGCSYYYTDTAPSDSTQPSAGKRSIDRLTNIFPGRAAIRPAIIASALGYVNRFQAYLDQYLNNLVNSMSAVTMNAQDPQTIPGKLATINAQIEQLEQVLDSRDGDMIASVNSAWSKDQTIVSQLASAIAQYMGKTETKGLQLVNQEAQAMLRQASKAITTNARMIDKMAAQKVRAANSSATAVIKLANNLWTGTNATIAKADTQFASMNSTLATLSSAKSNLTRDFSVLEASVEAAASKQFDSATKDTNFAQLTALSNVDTTLKQMAQAVTAALAALTKEEQRNLTTMSNNVANILTSLNNTINGYTKDAIARSAKLTNDYNSQLQQTAATTNQLFASINQNLGAINSSLTTSNTSSSTLQSYMQNQFTNLDSQIGALFDAQVQAARQSQTDLTNYMDTSLNTFKGYALNQSKDASADLQNAFNSAMSAVTSGSGALSMTFAQRQQVLAALKNWQQQYKGNTNQLVSAFQQTYSNLVSDTNAQLSDAIKDAMTRIKTSQDSQQALIDQAMKQANGNPAALQSILSQFGIVGDKAVAAVAVLQQQIAASGSAINSGLSDGMNALNNLATAAGSTQDIYSQAATLNAQAATVAGDAVQNVTNRLAVMNSYMNTYSSQISAALFNATSSAKDQISGASAAQDNQTQADIQAKMAQVQTLLNQAIASGHTSAADMAAFAAQVGANATVLTNMVNAITSGSSSGLADIAQVSQSSINNLTSTVKSQMDAANSQFSSSLAQQKANIGSLIEAMKSDLMNQSGAKSKQLVAARDNLQLLYGQLASSQIARDNAMKDLESQFNKAESQVALALPDLQSKIVAQQTRVNTDYQAKISALNDASAAVNKTIADTNATANADLAQLQAQGQQKIQDIGKALNDSSAAVAVMIGRYQNVMQSYLDGDRQARVDQNANELAQILGVQKSLNDSKAAQDAAYFQRLNSTGDRSAQLAAIMSDLSGAQAAASQGQAAFIDYVEDLAKATGISMSELVADMQDQVKSGSGKLATLLANNGMFLNSTMAALASDASAVQRGVVDGSTDVLGAVQDSMAKTSALSSAQMSQLGTLGDQTAALSQITGDQMTQLMTILLAQSAFQSDANMAQYKSALSRTADVKTAMNMYSEAMSDASQADVDALQEAASVSDDIDANAQATVQAATDAAMQAAQNYTDQANADYQAIQNALSAAEPVIEGLKTRVDNAQKTFEDQSPQIESQIASVQSDITKLQDSITSTQQGQVDRVTAWIRSMQTNTINSLKNFQAALATTTTTTTTTTPSTTSSTTPTATTSNTVAPS